MSSVPVPSFEIRHPGKLHDGDLYFEIVLVDENDLEAVVWSGTSYGEAILTAETEYDGERLPVFDVVVERGLP